jgi:hypothetical protein
MEIKWQMNYSVRKDRQTDGWRDGDDEVNNSVNETNPVHNFSCLFISILYMFRVTMCPSSGEITVLVLQLVFATEFG